MVNESTCCDRLASRAESAARDGLQAPPGISGWKKDGGTFPVLVNCAQNAACCQRCTSCESLNVMKPSWCPLSNQSCCNLMDLQKNPAGRLLSVYSSAIPILAHIWPTSAPTALNTKLPVCLTRWPPPACSWLPRSLMSCLVGQKHAGCSQHP